MDTFRFHEEHYILLLVCFSGLGLSALSTTVVYYDQTVKPSKFRQLRFYCAFSAVIVFLEVVMGLMFVGLMYTDHMRLAGIFEWILAFLGCFYMLAFIGFVA
ncbi:Mg2+ transporter protein CorA-like/Zinc transport protein [Neofusicoccum parvum]|uniref:Mg2+ transporter protein CorA-like/Zinc transport protein n=2 Tax=Neofusicoccum parvum TaxID=310453 RepID=A0ACB5SPT7_9PEZI|nr:putative frag1 dram sfk1 protein [Neofusicoccum parvum UCRNP2]GME39573.1 Mg2+ transporter protein CorA-like/Zinc transport protein [Neofusicoccum parvum]GME51913.1 Mg2+ transporter protein CorA-like/Zinc transport protein [Neofusicoccum parvum]